MPTSNPQSKPSDPGEITEELCRAYRYALGHLMQHLSPEDVQRMTRLPEADAKMVHVVGLHAFLHGRTEDIDDAWLNPVFASVPGTRG